MKYLFVVNPMSGGQDQATLEDEIAINAQKNDHTYELYHTNGSNDNTNVRHLIDTYHPDILAIAGGDGTINEMIGHVLDTGCTMGIYPSGSANGLAKELGIKKNEALSCLFTSNKRQALDVISINNKLMVHIADLGLNAKLVKRFENEGRQGFLGYAISAIKELPTFDEHFHVTLTTHDTVHRSETSCLAIANAKMYGTGFEINPYGKIDDQKVEICILKKHWTQLLKEAVLPDKNPDKVFDFHSADEFKIECDQPVNFQIDGETLGEVMRLSVKVLKKQAQVIVP